MAPQIERFLCSLTPLPETVETTLFKEIASRLDISGKRTNFHENRLITKIKILAEIRKHYRRALQITFSLAKVHD